MPERRDPADGVSGMGPDEGRVGHAHIAPHLLADHFLVDPVAAGGEHQHRPVVAGTEHQGLDDLIQLAADGVGSLLGGA